MRPLHGISKEGLGAGQGGRKSGLSEQNVYVWRVKGIRLAMKTYTFRSQNVYVSSVKRIRFRHETYTSWLGAEFASSGHGAQSLYFNGIEEEKEQLRFRPSCGSLAALPLVEGETSLRAREGRTSCCESAFLYRVAHYNSYLYTAHLQRAVLKSYRYYRS